MAGVRIEGVQLDNHKHIWIALQKVYGIGKTRARAICKVTGISEDTKVSTLDESHAKVLQDAVRKYPVEGVLRREISMAIKRLRDIGCYRGLRHKRGLPVRGQGTKNNARTRKGKRGKVIAKKK